MRGCLFVVVLAAVLIGAVAWFGSGPLVSGVIGTMLQASGWQASATGVTATADLPPRLLLGHADRVTIQGTDVDWRNLHANRLSLTLDGVEVLDRTADAVRGSITGATLSGGGSGTTPESSIELAGPASAAAATITIDGSGFADLVRAEVAKDYGVTLSDVRLAAPNVLQLVTPQATIRGTLAIDGNGALVVTTPLGPVTMLSVDPEIPLRLTSSRVVGRDLRLAGVLNVQSLIGGKPG